MLRGESEGQNLIKELGKGLTIEVVRSLDDPEGVLPLYNCHIDVPHLMASVTDLEYQFCASVTAQNLAEAMRLPASALWLQVRCHSGHHGASWRRRITQGLSEAIDTCPARL